jgi:hypothetical protein
MTDHQYKRLTKLLNKTRKPLLQACQELNLDVDMLDYDVFEKHCSQCTHCDIWGTTHVPDLDYNPICKVCLDIVGM